MAFGRLSARERFRSGGADDRLIAGTIVGVALALVVAAVLDLVGGGADPAVRAVRTAPVEAGSGVGEPVAFHRLMPDAMNGLGRLARVDGRVAGVESDGAFWVRDLRGHMVFVAAGGGDGAAVVARGEAVRVVGRIELVPRETARARRAPAGGASGGLLVRAVELVPIAGGVELLDR